MKSVGSYLLVFFMAMFWVFRIIVALTGTMGIEFAFQPINQSIEIILLFVTLLCIILVVKRKLIGSLLYLGIYGVYFGEHFITNILPMIEGQALTLDLSLNLIVDMVAIILGIFVVLDVLVDKARKANPKDGKTDWYFNNEKYDEELKARDQREDKNEYKFY